MTGLERIDQLRDTLVDFDEMMSELEDLLWGLEEPSDETIGYEVPFRTIRDRVYQFIQRESEKAEELAEKEAREK